MPNDCPNNTTCNKNNDAVCRNGHAMTMGKAEVDYVCDACGRNIDVDDILLVCRKCDLLRRLSIRHEKGKSASWEKSVE